jgi:hypothetical protein
MLAGFENLYEAPLPAFLIDVDSTEGTLPRHEERQSGKTDEMTVENVLWSHGGLVTGHEKSLLSSVPLQSL